VFRLGGLGLKVFFAQADSSISSVMSVFSSA
jgi:hypothetical protein